LGQALGEGRRLADVLADSGYAHRDADAWALPLRAAGASLVQDLHPHDRGPKGTHDGAIITFKGAGTLPAAVFVRGLTSKYPDDVKFVAGKSVPVAFAIWNGEQHDRNGRKMISNWYQLILDDVRASSAKR
jgi:DMSO reductase family type II enzyme heme b subunit